ncbi:precorrin-6Y C5,15-methyltransferase (decarboxylating) subunit CbiT [Lacrimispora saccharolytica]|uniref:precorrin-6Y C5,15-methyltransferase (decarboxylating) subunit CbiT n=1 Tax=Lacrimispora saccharolytica TaxID=84030 RepID=UPI0002EFB419|nr:precorrin-6Y C5,15-methyltransferase (decarboxylating) subunit CbiT [Lacrimispora saccharolytica]
MRDELFIRGEVPMTKSEVRAVSLSKLELDQDSVLYDIGAGTGSVSIEASRYLAGGRVYAIEKKSEAIALMRANKEKFAAECMEIVEGEAPEALSSLEAPSHVFIGGTSGSMDKVLSLVLKKNPEARIVINTIALESLAEVVSWLKGHSVTAEIVQVQISKGRKAGDYHLMMGQNPVYVVSFGGKRRNIFE